MLKFLSSVRRYALLGSPMSKFCFSSLVVYPINPIMSWPYQA